MNAATEGKSIIEMPAFSRREERDIPAIVPQNPMAMVGLAVARGMDPATLKDLMDLQQRWEKSEAEKAYNVAFAAFKAEAVSVIRNKTVTDGPLKGKSYAELFAVVDAVTPALSAHGLSASWKVTKDEKDWIEVTCYLKHVLGHAETVSFGGPPDAGGAKNAIQARASTKSYLERYTLLAITGMSSKDADANGGKPAVEPDPAGKTALEACGSLPSLQEAWKKLTPAQRKTLGAVKDACKARIEEADMEAAK
jgi:hypothetical protein